MYHILFSNNRSGLFINSEHLDYCCLFRFLPVANNYFYAASTETTFNAYIIQGLITEARENIDPDARSFARKVKEIERQGLREGASLAEVVSVLHLLLLLKIGCLNN